MRKKTQINGTSKLALYGGYIAQVTLAIPSGPFFAGFRAAETLQSTLDGIIGCVNHWYCSSEQSTQLFRGDGGASTARLRETSTDISISH